MKTTIAALTAGLVLASGTQLQAGVDFDKQIKPLMEKYCINCHAAPYKKGSRTKKPKAGLRIDTREHLLKGSDDGVVVKPGDAANSSFYKLTTLHADHDDIMPPKGDPMTKDEQALLKAWIDEGVKWTDGVVLKRQED